MAGALTYLVFTYLLAAIPFGVVITTLWGDDDTDIRAAGSGNIGVTNVARVYGWTFAVPVLVLDVGKGFLPVWFAPYMVEDGGYLWQGAVGSVAFLGHCYPIYLALRGGKGVATGSGAMLAMAPVPTSVAALVWAVLLLVTGRSSVASLGATGALVGLIWMWVPALRVLVLLLAAGVIYAHVQNIGRLVRGEEARVLPAVRWGRRAVRDEEAEAVALLEAGPAGVGMPPTEWPAQHAEDA